MGFFANVFGAVVSAVSTIIDVVSKTAVTIVDEAVKAVDRYRRDADRRKRPPAERRREEAADELRDVNDELISITEKRGTGRQLSSDERRRAEYLYGRRDELKREIEEADEELAVKEIADESEAFEKMIVGNNTAHVLQGQIGITMFGKTCPDCGRPMLVQWPRSVDTAKVTDFGWGCSGWYERGPGTGSSACSKWIPFAPNDLSLFARTDAPEFQIGSRELTDLVLLPGPQETIRERMNDLTGSAKPSREGVEEYRCPTHGEALMLRKKREAKGLLDQYFLGCPRWRPENQGCGYVVKLKSAAQLAMFLKRETGTGIL
jgi:hypothetical protein